MDAALKREDTERLTEGLNRLTKLYARHLVVEDESVFPLAAAVLSHTEKAHIGIEMAERRGLDPKRTLERARELAGLLK
jgi:hemerythrin-like domain-containing protein